MSSASLIEVLDHLDGRLPDLTSAVGPQLTLSGGAIRLLNRELGPEVEWPLPWGDPSKLLASQGTELFVVRTEQRLALLNGSRVTAQAQLRADAACFVAPDRLLIAAAEPPDPGRSFSERQRVALLDGTLQVLDELSIEADEAHPFLIPHPAGEAALAEFPMGQDGTLIFAVHTAEDRLRLTEVLPQLDCVPLGFDRIGERLLVAPYPSDPDEAMVLSWPGLAILSTITSGGLGLEIGFDLSGGFLADGRALLLATEQGPILAAADLAEPTLLELAGVETIGPTAFIETIAPLGPDRFAAVLWADGKRMTSLWQLHD